MTKPSDDDFRYVGMTEEQIDMLQPYDDATRQVVYDEAIRQLVEEEFASSDTYYTI